MILTCPACSTRYKIADNAISATGRSVKCARCGHEWHQTPEDLTAEAPAGTGEPSPAKESLAAAVQAAAADDAAAAPEAPAPAPGGAAAPAADGDTAEDADAGDHAAGEADEEAELAAGSARRARARQAAMARTAAETPRRGVGVAVWLLLLIIVAGVAAAGYIYRDRVVEIWPPAGKFYRTIGTLVDKPDLGLVIRNVESTREIQGGQVVLLVAGEVVNNSGERKPIPNLRVALGDENRQELYHWTVTATEAELPPGGSTRFQSRLPNPPDNARKLVVTFLLDAEQ